MSNLHPRRVSKRAAALDAVNKIKSNLEDLNLCEESVDRLRRRQSDDSATLCVEESNEENETPLTTDTKRANNEEPVLADEFEFKEDESSLMDESIPSSTDSKSTSCPSSTTSEESDHSAETVLADEFEFNEDESTLVDEPAVAADSKSTMCASTASEESEESEESNDESEESDESSTEEETVREVTWSEWDRYQQYMDFKRRVEAKREARAAARCKHSDRKMVLSRRLSHNIRVPSFSPVLSPVTAQRLRFSPEANTIANNTRDYSMYFPPKNKRQRKNY